MSYKPLRPKTPRFRDPALTKLAEQLYAQTVAHQIKPKPVRSRPAKKSSQSPNVK